ncbi:carbohydrate sulfotransferase 3-like, partial [Procambarus clarkii]
KEGGSGCKRGLELRSTCKISRVRVVKVIRSRLSWLEGLLNDPSLNIKIIHLIRDPRGSLKSIKKLNWNSKPSFRCGALEDDMRHYDILLKKYPAQVTRLRLEKLSIEPFSTVSNLYKFLYGNQSLGKETVQFLKEHTAAPEGSVFPGDNMETRRNSSREYQAWRWRIPSLLLKETEGEPACRAVITRLGHALFGSIHNVRNATLPLDTTLKQK